MLFQLACAIIFLLAAIPERARAENLCMSVFFIATCINTAFGDASGDLFYFTRATFAMAAAWYLSSRSSSIGFYQAIILLFVLTAYAALEYDFAHGENILIYSNFESVIYGLVICQLIGILPTIRSCYYNYHSGGWVGSKYLPRNKRA